MYGRIRVISVVVAFVVALTALVGTRVSAGDHWTAVYGTGRHEIRVATGSPGELGLLKALAERFNQGHDTRICWQKAGSGKALELLRQKEVDIALVHAPSAERKAVKEGWARDRTLIGSNEFYLVGPKEDPAGVAPAKTVVEAYSRIAMAGANFVSRGDNSGTNKKELAIWRKAGITPKGEWYIVTHDFMTASLREADRVKGYFMTDSSTWLRVRKDLKTLAVLFRGDPVLRNEYHGLCRSDCSTQAEAFLRFLASEEGQAIICNFGRELLGEPLYHGAREARSDASFLRTRMASDRLA